VIEEYAKGNRVILIFDEAQNLSRESLEELRMFTNINSNKDELLQLVLVGQPELLEVITRPELRQLRQRIGVHCKLNPLNRDETEAYVYHRLETAGNREALIWHEGTFDLLYRYSGGIPRLINQFCDFALLCVFAEESRELSLEMLCEVIGDIAWEVPKPSESFEHDDSAGHSFTEKERSLDECLTMLNAVWGDDDTRVRRMARDEHFQQAQLESMGRIESMLDKIFKRLGSMLNSTQKDSGHGSD
jgi:hypothetical protein